MKFIQVFVVTITTVYFAQVIALDPRIHVDETKASEHHGMNEFGNMKTPPFSPYHHRHGYGMPMHAPPQVNPFSVGMPPYFGMYPQPLPFGYGYMQHQPIYAPHWNSYYPPAPMQYAYYPQQQHPGPWYSPSAPMQPPMNRPTFNDPILNREMPKPVATPHQPETSETVKAKNVEPINQDKPPISLDKVMNLINRDELKKQLEADLSSALGNKMPGIDTDALLGMLDNEAVRAQIEQGLSSALGNLKVENLAKASQ